jgi:hypothetical protein
MGENNNNKGSSSGQPHQRISKIQHFGDHLRSHHPDDGDGAGLQNVGFYKSLNT